MQTLSVVINTKNAATTLKRTLKSVRFADEVVIVDMQSTDATLAIAQEVTDRIFSVKDVGYVEPARNTALSKATGDWILLVDADEEVPETLRDYLFERMEQPDSAEAYYLPRKNIVFGTWYHYAGWWPDYQLRFFKRGTVTWPTKIHAQPETTSKPEYVPAKEELALVHHNYQTVEQFIDRLNRYTTHEAANRRSTGTPQSSQLIRAFHQELLSRLFRHQGIDGGMHGVSLSFLQAMYELVVVAKQWQAAGFRPTTNDQGATLEALKSFQQDLSYWMADWQVHHTSGVEQLIWRIRRRFRI